MKTPNDLAKIVEQLQEWIDNTDDFSSVPQAHLDWSLSYFQIGIGQITVFDSEENDNDELTFESCRARYIAELENLLPFLKKDLK